MTETYKKGDVVKVLQIAYDEDTKYTIEEHTILGTVDIVHRDEDGNETVTETRLKVTNPKGKTYITTKQNLDYEKVSSRLASEISYAKQDLKWAEESLTYETKRVEEHKKNIAALEALIA